MVVKNLFQLLANSWEKYPDKICLVSNEKKYTYNQLMEMIINLSTVYKDNDLKSSDRVLIIGGNNILTITGFWSSFVNNSCITILNPELSSEKIEYIINDLKPKIIVSDVYKSNIHKIITSKYISLNNINSQNYKINLQTFLESCDLGIDLDLASIIYTSGSTGNPKGVMLSHQNMISATNSISNYLEIKSNDNILNILPLSFDYGLYQMILAFTNGCMLVLDENSFPIKSINLIEKYQISILPVVPSLINFFYNYYLQTKKRFLSVKKVTNTGAAMTNRHFEALDNIFTNAQIFSMYGLTECKRCSYLPPKYSKNKRDSVGIAIPNTQLWIEDNEGNKLPPNSEGELVVRGSTVMLGYWNNPYETNKKLKPGKLPYERVLRTADLARIDEEGFIYLNGRKEEIIKNKGIKVIPIEVENIIMSFDSIKEVAAIGINDENLGEIFIIFISVYKDYFSKPDFKEYILNKLEPSQKPSKICEIENLPKSFNGKIDKINLSKIYSSGEYREI
jgi:acyl-CoA synthetase (AMP-forming)/AMP-acid ligase II